jgi:hypothetical protein
VLEVVLPRRAVLQPQPSLHAEGDCGACVLAGLLAVSVDEVYRRKGEVSPFCWVTLLELLADSYWSGELDRLVSKVPFWPSPDGLRSFGDPGWLTNLEWFDYLRMGLDGGYYGLMNYSMEGDGPLALPDHFVMVVGARDREVPNPNCAGSSVILRELLISDSSSKREPEHWEDHLTLLREHGGYNVLLARPTGHGYAAIV